MTTQKALLERAKEGDGAAIASLMNKMLASQGARVQIKAQNKAGGHDYKILIESAQVPNQAARVKWIVQGLTKLGIANLKTVTIYGKSQQSDRPEWKQIVQFPLKSTTQENLVQQSSTTENNNNNKPTASTASEEPDRSEPDSSESASSEPEIDLSEYCFTRNKSLLSGNLTPPAEKVSQIVLAIAALPNEQKLALLPHCTKLLRKPEPIEDEALSPESQQIVESILPLEGNDVRKLSIWLSRYCANPAETVETLTPKAAEPEPETAAPADDSASDSASDSAQPNSEQHSRTQQHSANTARTYAGANRLVNADKRSQANSSSPPSGLSALLTATDGLPVWVIPTVWAVGLMIAIALGINSVGQSAAASYAYPMCDDSTASAEVCTLAVQLSGGDEIALQEAAEISAPVQLSETLQSQVTAQCSEFGFWESAFREESFGNEDDLTTAYEAVEVLSSKTHTVFPGVLLTDITQKSSAEAPATRVACVDYLYRYTESEAFEYGVTAGETGVETWASDVIPMDWPTEPYSELSGDTLVMAQSLGIYDTFITFGASTMFTAIGIAIAVLFCSCYRCDSLHSVYQAACMLGIVETVMSWIPTFSLTASLAVNVASIGIVSMLVPGFHVDWTDGYGPLARGAITITSIRFVLLLILYQVIYQIVGGSV